MPSRIYFPARGNASSLVAGGPAASVRRRLIIAALMHDQVIVDDGLWHGRAGPGGSYDFWPRMDGPAAFQSAAARGRAKARNFYAAATLDGSTGPPRALVHSETTIAWEATFDPIKRELGHAYPWIEFANLEMDQDGRALVRRMVRADEADGTLSGQVPDEWSRKLVIASADSSIVIGSGLDAAISLDAMHQRVVQARLSRGDAQPVYGGHALSIMFPAVDRMDWEDVNRARNQRGLADLRALLGEVEEAAWSEAENGRQLDAAIRLAYQVRFHEAATRLSGSGRATAVATVVGIAITVATAGLPLLIGVAAGAGYQISSDRFAAVERQRSWIAAADHLTRRP